MTALLRYDAACHALAEAKSFDEVRDWVNKAAAVREYARRSRNRQLEIDAIEIRVRAKRRYGELLRDYKDAGKLRQGNPQLSSTDDNCDDDAVSLETLGLTQNESSEAQKIAAIEGDAFERLVARCRAYTEANPKRHAFDVLKPPPGSGPINGARTVMGSRVEPDDSLDYFPTPPWATRALIEKVLPQVGARADCARQQAWEPACGEGHIAGVLEEYFGTVVASDVHDYGCDGRMPPGWWGFLNFLEPEDGVELPAADWIITNPPFHKKTEGFVLRALELARVGVAVFVRMQWLETKGRYERIFRDRPPTVVAFFAERVPLCKGEWKPEGDTATAYVWLVWLKGRAPQAPFWIPPDCRDLLSRDDDAERFTAHPVTAAPADRPLRVAADGSPTDFETGEILADPTGAENAQVAQPEPASAPSPASSTVDQAMRDYGADDGIPSFLRRGDPACGLGGRGE